MILGMQPRSTSLGASGEKFSAMSLKKKIARVTRQSRVQITAGLIQLRPDVKDRITAARDALQLEAVGEAAALLFPLIRRPETAALVRTLFSVHAEVFHKAVDKLAETDADQSIQAAEMAWFLKPSGIHAYGLMARLRVAGRYDEGVAVMEEAAERFPKDPAWLVHAALLNADRGEAGLAVEQIWKYAATLTRFNPAFRKTLARVMRQFARQCHSAGQKTEHQHPLVEPDIALEYFGSVEANVAAWSDNPFARALHADSLKRHHARPAEPATGVAERPKRLLIVTSDNWNFLTNLLDHYAVDDRTFEVRTFDFSPIQQELTADIHAIFGPQSMGVKDEAMWAQISAVSPTFGELVEWSDVVLCEWAGAHALWLSRYLPTSARLVLRLHSYEAFSQWPLFMNWGGVDGVIFVADHIRQFSRLQYGLDRYNWLDTTVLPNFNHLQKFARPKTTRANRTLGMVGFNNWNKDPLFAVQILADLVAEDPDWRLVLVGHPWPDEGKPKELAYRTLFDDAVARAGLADHVEYRSHSRDLPAVFQDIGFVLSTSWREGTHETVLEGMASGAIPVIRQWPMTRPFGAPETVYPDQEYCETPAEAAAIVRRYASPDAFKTRSATARRYAMKRFDMTAVLPDFERFVSGVAVPSEETA